MTFVLRAALGGILMGLANLVPGISGGTMLLAVGLYPLFIGGIAEVTTFKFKPKSLLLLGTIVAFAILSILFGAGMIKDLVVNHRWIMYSIFIGLTLGGVPLVWRLAMPVNKTVYAGAVAGFVVMVIMAITTGIGSKAGDQSYFLLFLSGLGGASAMILPGVSGSYLLLLLGQYQNILGAVDQVKTGLLGDSATGAARDLALVFDAFHVVIPVGIGVVVGIIGVSNLLKWLLAKHEKATLGVLLGLLLGAVVGIFPFQEAVMPQPGDMLHGEVLTPLAIAELDAEDWPVDFFFPTAGQMLASTLLIVLGFGATLLVDRFGQEKEA